MLHTRPHLLGLLPGRARADRPADLRAAGHALTPPDGPDEGLVGLSVPHPRIRPGPDQHHQQQPQADVRGDEGSGGRGAPGGRTEGGPVAGDHEPQRGHDGLRPCQRSAHGPVGERPDEHVSPVHADHPEDRQRQGVGVRPGGGLAVLRVPAHARACLSAVVVTRRSSVLNSANSTRVRSFFTSKLDPPSRHRPTPLPRCLSRDRSRSERSSSSVVSFSVERSWR
ncbi:hypothetical protein ACFFX0_29125 [Citricoccus parietis]|uniref:Uncharacterized protein n=1 Tax=Citricoccus parietis TaxID=592307 RepID=A0ABV5G9A3_9MICC